MTLVWNQRTTLENGGGGGKGFQGGATGARQSTGSRGGASGAKPRPRSPRATDAASCLLKERLEEATLLWAFLKSLFV